MVVRENIKNYIIGIGLPLSLIIGFGVGYTLSKYITNLQNKATIKVYENNISNLNQELTSKSMEIQALEDTLKAKKERDLERVIEMTKLSEVLIDVAVKRGTPEAKARKTFSYLIELAK